MCIIMQFVVHSFDLEKISSLMRQLTSIVYQIIFKMHNVMNEISILRIKMSIRLNENPTYKCKYEIIFVSLRIQKYISFINLLLYTIVIVNIIRYFLKLFIKTAYAF